MPSAAAGGVGLRHAGDEPDRTGRADADGYRDLGHIAGAQQVVEGFLRKFSVFGFQCSAQTQPEPENRLSEH